jgi:two-component system response regulator AtoC
MSRKMELNKPKKIFIVDADHQFATSLSSALADKANHEIHLFDNCTDCLNEFSHKPEIIILDNELNEQHEKNENMKLLEVIRKDYPDVHVIVLARNEGYGTAMQTILKGAEQYLMKDENTISAVGLMVDELN